MRKLRAAAARPLIGGGRRKRRVAAAEMAEAPPGAGLAALPDSVLLEVLALLPLRDRLRAGRVCRRWWRLGQDRALWRHVDLSPHRLSSRTLWHLLRRHLRGSLRTLKVKGALCSARKHEVLSPALLAALGKHCPHLGRLCLAEADLRLLPYRSMPASLKTLELSHCEIPSAWFQGTAADALPQLQHLIVCNVPAFCDQHLLNVSSQAPLKTLTLSGTYRVTDAGIQRAAVYLGGLERLVLRHCVITDSAVHFIGHHLKSLRLLEISNAYSLTNAGLACLATLKRLETLCLDLCDKFSPDAVVALCQALPQLRNLNLDGAHFEDEAICKIQASLPNCSFSHTP
ncbi:F-box/LRR-repeat protein 12 [Dromaius novaehollandiae]|uniref:F-box/LRR-repeat protein 12 n=1 Tax=Dromaius novaehollandiae TaxID=8790 RepID=UPI00311F46E5